MPNQKLDIQDQINDLLSLGVLVGDKKYAEQYLSSHVNYYRLSSYLRLCEYQGMAGALINGTSFEHLVELSRIDYQLRKILLEMAIDIEFYQKLELNTDCSQNPQDDGIQIVNDFLYNNGVIDAAPALNKNSECSYSKRIVQKHYPEIRIWHLVEILSFGKFIFFFKKYYSVFPSNSFNYGTRNSELYATSKIRNACAHNNFILPTLLNIPDKQDRRLTLLLRTLSINNPNQLTKAEEVFIKNSVLLSDIVYVCLAYKDIVLPRDTNSTIPKRLHELLDSISLSVGKSFSKNVFLTKCFKILDKSINLIFP